MSCSLEFDCTVVLEGPLPNSWGYISEFEYHYHNDRGRMSMRAAQIKITISLPALDMEHATRQALKVVDEAKAASQIPADFDVMDIKVRSTA